MRDEEVFTINNEQVLSGMFAVGKGSYLDTEEEIQRIIMNLIPRNAVHPSGDPGSALDHSVFVFMFATG